MKSRNWTVLFVFVATLSGGLHCDGGDDTCSDCSCDPSLCDGGADGDGDTAVERCTELLVESTPAGAAIELDGEPSGEVTPHTFTNLPVGLHTFLLSLDGYDAIPAEVTVTTECAPVNITLYPSVEGEWVLIYRNPAVGDESFTWNLAQTGETITGSGSDGCNYAGNITVDGAIHLFADDCGSTTTTLDGSLINPNRMEGDWTSDSPWGEASGTWWADRP